MTEPTKPGVNVSSGDKGVDRSQTTVDNSSRVTNTADDHSVRSSTVDDHSVRTTTVSNNSSRIVNNHAEDNRRKSHVSISGGTVPAVMALVVVVVLVIWIVPRGGATPVIVVPQIQSPPAANSTAPVEMRPVVESPPGVPPEPVVIAVPKPATEVAANPRRAEPLMPAARAPGRPVEPAKLDPTTFINRGMMRPGSTAVLMVDQSRGADAVLTQQVAALVQGSDGLFKPAFVADGLFSRVHQGDADLLRELGLTADVARVLLGTRTTSYSPTEVAGVAMVRAAVTLSVRVIRPAAGFASGVAAAREVGAGFDQDSALEVATRNALKKLFAELNP